MNAEQQKAVEHLKERMSAHPRAAAIGVEIEHLKQLDSLITELEADKRRLDWMNRSRLDYVRGTDYPAWRIEGLLPHRQIATDQTLRQAIDAAMKGAV